MKTFKLSLLAVSLLFLFSFTLCSTSQAASDAASSGPAVMTDTSPLSSTDDGSLSMDSDDDAFDIEQYASDDSGDDDTYMGDPEEDLEPAPDLEAPAPSGDDGGDAEPEPPAPSDEE